jgi:hypothetical protein
MSRQAMSMDCGKRKALGSLRFVEMGFNVANAS